MAQSSNLLEGCAVMIPRLDEADEVLHANSEEAALCDSSVSPWGPNHVEGLGVNAPAKPPLVTESHARKLTSKSPFKEASTKNDTKTVCSRPIARSNDLLQGKSPGSASQQQDDGWHQVGRGPEAGTWNDLLSPKEKGSMADNSIHLVQVEPIVSRDDSLVQTNLL